MSARLDTHRHRLDDHEQRLAQLEQRPEPMVVETPVGKFPLHVIIIVLSALAIWRPELAAKLIGQ